MLIAIESDRSLAIALEQNLEISVSIPNPKTWKNLAMLKITPLALGLLALLSIAANAQAAMTNTSPQSQSVQQPAIDLHAQIIIKLGGQPEPRREPERPRRAEFEREHRAERRDRERQFRRHHRQEEGRHERHREHHQDR
jgi:hypothetical protein